MNPGNWAELSVGVAAVVGLVYVARTMRGIMSDVLLFMENHLSGVTKSLVDLNVSTGKMAERMERLPDVTAERMSERIDRLSTRMDQLANDAKRHREAQGARR
jgi:hypothetical protein